MILEIWGIHELTENIIFYIIFYIKNVILKNIWRNCLWKKYRQKIVKRVQHWLTIFAKITAEKAYILMKFWIRRWRRSNECNWIEIMWCSGQIVRAFSGQAIGKRIVYQKFYEFIRIKHLRKIGLTRAVIFILTDKGNTRIFELIELCISESNQSSQKQNTWLDWFDLI